MKGVINCVKEKGFLQMHVFVFIITQGRPFERFSQEENTVSGDTYPLPHQDGRQITLFSSSRWCCSDCCCGHCCCRCRSSCNVMIFGIKLSPTLSWALITCQDGIAKIASLCNHRWYLWKKLIFPLGNSQFQIKNANQRNFVLCFHSINQPDVADKGRIMIPMRYCKTSISTLKIPHLKIAHQGGNLEVGNLDN